MIPSGHEKGDAVILKAAEFIRRYLTEQASGFRIGGDEFVMLIRDCTEEKVQELVSTMRGDEKGKFIGCNSRVLLPSCNRRSLSQDSRNSGRNHKTGR